LIIQFKFRMYLRRHSRPIIDINDVFNPMDCLMREKLKKSLMFTGNMVHAIEYERAAQLMSDFLSCATMHDRFIILMEDFLSQIHKIQFVMKSQIMYNKTRNDFLRHEYRAEFEAYKDEIETEGDQKVIAQFQHYNESYANSLINHYLDRCKMSHKLAFTQFRKILP